MHRSSELARSLRRNDLDSAERKIKEADLAVRRCEVAVRVCEDAEKNAKVERRRLCALRNEITETIKRLETEPEEEPSK